MRKRIAALVATAVAVSALTGSALAAPAGGGKTIVDVAAGDARFSTLVSLVQQAGLVETLSGKGKFTVFAPTNAAFTKLKKQAPDTYAAVVGDPELLTKVLTYHVVGKHIGSKAAIAAAKKNGSVKTVQGERIALSLRNGGLFLNGTSKVVVADVKTSNGVIHAINTLLVPPSLAG